VYDKDGAQGVAYGLQGQPAKVVLYTIAGHGHHWPGGKSALPESLAGKNTAKLKATDVIWAFFKAHPIADKTGAQQDAPADSGPLPLSFTFGRKEALLLCCHSVR